VTDDAGANLGAQDLLDGFAGVGGVAAGVSRTTAENQDRTRFPASLAGNAQRLLENLCERAARNLVAMSSA